MLHAVILAGGSGTRFWPLSRRDRPKQLVAFAGERTMLQATYDRVRPLVPHDGVVVVTSAALAPAIREQLPDLSEDQVVGEPEPRDTALAIGLAAGLIARRDPEAVLVVTPSDHVVEPASTFAAAIAQAAQLAATRGAIVTLGLRPRSAHTGYGYIRRGKAVPDASPFPVFEVAAFAEKPDKARAEQYLAGGEHDWNSGVFVWTARTVLDALAEHAPATRAAVDAAVGAWDGPDREPALRAAFAAAPRISIDYAVLEKARDVLVVEPELSWSDVGSWSALRELHAGSADAAGNVTLGAPLIAHDASDCLVMGDGRAVAIVGLSGVAVVQTKDATLVVPLARAEDVKKLVARLDEQGLSSLG